MVSKSEINQAVQSLQPNDYFSYLRLGKRLLAQNQLDEALLAYQQAIALKPHEAWLYSVSGKIFLTQGKLEQALAAYQKAIDLKPDEAWFYYSLGEVLSKQNQIGEALLAYQQAITLKSDEAWLYSALGKTLFKQGKFPQAQEAYQKAIELQPNEAWLYFSLGEVLVKQNQLDEALLAYQQAIALKPDEVWLYSALGKAFLKQGKLPQAQEAYQKAIELQPNEAWLYFSLGEVLVKQNQLDEAVVAYRKAIELQPPDFYWTHDLLGDVLIKIGQIEEAITCYKTALKKQIVKFKPHLAEATWYLGKPTEPQFFVIGFAKCGTTSLYEYLIQHPQILPSAKKEVMFFSENFNQGMDWYLAHFPSIPEEQNYITGEASAHYIDHPLADERLFNQFPHVKLVVLLRNPVERTFSDYQMWARAGGESRSFAEAITFEIERIQEPEDMFYEEKPRSLAARQKKYAHLFKKLPQQAAGYANFGKLPPLSPSYLSGSLYVHHLKRWRSLFPKEQFLILQSEEFNRSPEKILNQVFQFLGLPAYHLSNYPKYNTGKYAPIEPQTRHTLVEYFRPHNQMLEEYLDLKFNWD